MAPTTPHALGGQSYTAAAPWATLPQAVLDRTCFWHVMTNTPIHPKEPQVLGLMGATQAGEMFPSIIAKQLAPCLGTIQTQPISLGAASPSEALVFGGQALPIIPPLALKATLTSAAGPLTNLAGSPRPDDEPALRPLQERSANRGAAAAYIDLGRHVAAAGAKHPAETSSPQLGSIKDNTALSQVTAAVTLIQMKVDARSSRSTSRSAATNHRDHRARGRDRADRRRAPRRPAASPRAGVADDRVADERPAQASAGLQDQVTLHVRLNVFGRTIGPGQHRRAPAQPEPPGFDHAIGKPFNGGGHRRRCPAGRRLRRPPDRLEDWPGLGERRRRGGGDARSCSGRRCRKRWGTSRAVDRTADHERGRLSPARSRAEQERGRGHPPRACRTGSVVQRMHGQTSENQSGCRARVATDTLGFKMRVIGLRPARPRLLRLVRRDRASRGPCRFS